MNWLNLKEEEVMEIVVPIMENLMDASTEIDHERHIRDFGDNMKAIVTKESFERQCREYQSELGFFRSRELIGVIRRARDVRVFWRQWYSNTDDEYLAFLHVKEIGGEYKVVNVSVS